MVADPKPRSGKKKKPRLIRVGPGFKDEAPIRARLRGNTGNPSILLAPDGRMLPLTNDEGRLRTYRPSEPWVDATFSQVDDVDADGDPISIRWHDPSKQLPPGMVRCVKCGRATPDNCIEGERISARKVENAIAGYELESELLAMLPPVNPLSLADAADELDESADDVAEAAGRLAKAHGDLLLLESEYGWLQVAPGRHGAVQAVATAYWERVHERKSGRQRVEPRKIVKRKVKHRITCADCRPAHVHELHGASPSAVAIRAIQMRCLRNPPPDGEESQADREKREAVAYGIKLEEMAIRGESNEQLLAEITRFRRTGRMMDDETR
jgi:hypothetical protein